MSLEIPWPASRTPPTRGHVSCIRQLDKKHPDQWEKDLNPHRLAGQNIGAQADEEASYQYASEVKDLVRQLQYFTLDELREIPVLLAGTRLQQGATYIDLRDPNRSPFTATGDMIATADTWFVSKSATPYMYWNRLIGVRDVERTQ